MAATVINNERTEIRIQGKDTDVPSTKIHGRTVIMTGRWIKVASVHDEFFVEGEIVPDPDSFLAGLKRWEIKPDLFTFPEKVSQPAPRFSYHTKWEDFAVIPITTYQDWLLKQIKKDVKENLRRAVREGVVVRVSPYDDQFVQGIKDLCDETPVRQGKPFWHHGKSFENIKKVHGTYRERAEYIGAYFGDELIGFIKMVYVGNIAKTMNVISKEKYFQKRPTNALIAKAVEVCAEKGIAHFNYGQYNFPGKAESSLTDFKRRHGFQEIKFPRYYIPLTLNGSMAIKLGLHLGYKRFIPPAVNQMLLKIRAGFYRSEIGTKKKKLEAKI